MSVIALRASLLVAVFSALVVPATVDGSIPPLWWNLGVTDCGLRRGSNCPTCAQFLNNTLTEGQAEKCYADSTPIEAIASGSRSAIIECQAQFADKQWNCSTFFSHLLFGKFIAEDSTRETGVLQAFFAAGAVKGVAAACHEQKIRDCVCNLDGPVEDTDAENNLIYRDCKEDSKFAIDYVLNFIFPGLSVSIVTERYSVTFQITKNADGSVSTSIEKTPIAGVDQPTTDPTADPESYEPYTKILNDVHNTVVGLKAINQTSQECVCHGLSGTCSIQTCYTRIKEVSEIGEELTLKYSGAVKVTKENNSTKLISLYGNDDPSEADLVYVNESPNFCNPDKTKGVLGTKDRKCVPNGDASDSCQRLCCEHGFYTKSFRVPKEICEFKWCCRIECRPDGYDEITEHRCNGPPSNQG